MKELLEFLSNLVQITGNNVADSIIIGVICLISFSVAFGIVGIIFDFLGFYDSDIMSGVHWSIRLIVFLLLTFICLLIVQFIKKILVPYWWVFLIAGLFLIGIIVLIHILKHKFSKKKKEAEDKGEEVSETENLKNIKEYCPRCGGLLVKRQGPYGTFYGCVNYSLKNCKYTRKFK